MKLTADVVAGFVGSILSKRFDESVASPEFHHELWDLACSDYQYVAVAAPRGHAKSTAGTISYGLASLLFRESDFCVVVSDTESQAAAFVGAMKDEVTQNEDLIELFNLAKDEKGAVKLLKDTETEFIAQFSDGHKFRVLAKGAEQKLRGSLWNGKRPNLVLVDDLENDELVMNKDRRTKLRRWFFGALVPLLAPRGKMRIWGTILHMDSLLESFMPRFADKMTREEGLKVYSLKNRGMWKAVKYRAHDDRMTTFLWPERFGKEYFIAKREEYLSQGISDVYSQEYLNEPIDDSVAYFKLRDLVERTKDDGKKRLRYYITGDLAISEEETADWTVFIVGGMDEDRILHIVNVIRERLDGKEIVDLILALHRTYEPEAIGIEEMQISKAIGPFLREEMFVQNTFPNVIPMKHRNKDKIQRSRSFQARVRARGVRFAKEEDWYPHLEDELLKFPRARHDDQVDALAYLGLLVDKMIEAQTDEEVAEEDYELELQQSGIVFDGRSAITGY
jgi:predicted phage terminase large subunit-like protein